MITQAEIDIEIDKLKKLIGILARRGYILKSELLKLLPACRATHMNIGSLEELMYSVIDETVEYRDDVINTDSYRACADLQEQFSKRGYRNLYEYLQLQNDATIELVEQTVRAHMLFEDKGELRLLQIILGVIIAKQLLDVYRDFVEMDRAFEELELRREFGIDKISRQEIQEYAQSLEEEKGIPRERAEELLTQGAHEKGIDIIHSGQEREKKVSNEKAQKHTEETGKQQEFDEFLISVRDIENERTKSEKGQGHGRGQ